MNTNELSTEQRQTPKNPRLLNAVLPSNDEEPTLEEHADLDTSETEMAEPEHTDEEGDHTPPEG